MPTLRGAWERYRDEHLDLYAAPKAAQRDGYYFAAVPWPDRRLDAIEADDARALHLKLTRGRGPAMANRVIVLLQRIFNYAIDELGYDRPNPVRPRHGRRGRGGNGSAVVPMNPERSRDRFLLPTEAPAFFQALRDYPEADFRDLILLLLFTGCRRGNVQSMRWEQVDLGQALWTIPRTKAGREQKVPLSGWAMDVLARRHADRDDSGWVFPAAKSASGHLEEPKKHWHALREQAGLADLTMHDLRRTLATYQRTAGAEWATISASMGHSAARMTEIYARTDLRPVRASIENATKLLLTDAGQDALPAEDTDDEAEH